MFFFQGCETNPVTGKKELMLVDEAWEIETGEKFYPIYTQENMGVYPDANLQGYVEGVGLSLAKVSHRPHLPYAYNCINQPVINAYALPGGKISITRPLLVRMETEAQLAFVLGHETAHVNLRHAAHGYSRAMLTQVLLLGGLVALEASDVDNKEYYMLAGLLGSQLLLLHYSRDQEREADYWGFRYMTKVGYHPEGMVEALSILFNEEKHHPSKLENIFQTHPLTKERIEKAKELATKYSGEAHIVRKQAFLKATQPLKKTRKGYEHFDKAYELIVEDKLDNALQELRQASRLLPNHAIVHAIQGLVFYEKKMVHQAEKKGLRAYALDPNLFWSSYVLGQVYVTTKKYNVALPYLEKADSLYPERLDVRYFLGLSYEKTGKKDKAKEYYQFVVDNGSGELQQKAKKRLEKLS